MRRHLGLQLGHAPTGGHQLRVIGRGQARSHGVGQGVRLPMSDLFGVAGGQLLDDLRMDPAYNARIVSLRRLIDALDFEIDVVARPTATKLAT